MILEVGTTMEIMVQIYGQLHLIAQILFLILTIFKMDLVGLTLPTIPIMEILEIGGIIMDLEIVLEIYTPYLNHIIKTQECYFPTVGWY